MIKTWMARAALLLSALTGSACADEESVKKQLAERFPDLTVSSVKKAPVAGWYEVFAGQQMFYTDEKAEFVFVGNIIDAKTKRNLTQERIQDLLRVRFDALPFEDAIKIVKGNGVRRLATFEDPDCPYCKRLGADLAQLDDYTLYVFLLPIDQLHPKAVEKSARIWCAPDRAKAWLDYMLNNKLPANKPDCATPIARIAQLANELRIQGTPAIVFEDGRLVPGAVPKERLEELLTQAASRKAAKPAEPGAAVR